MWPVLFILSMSTSAQAAYRVVGGREANIQEFPYTVSIENGNIHRAGGVLIRPDVVVTAADCVHQYSAHYLTIRAGSTKCSDANSLSIDGETAGVAAILIHPKFSYYELDYNVAVLHLNRSFYIGSTIQAVLMVGKNEEQSDGNYATLSGWGGNGYSHTLSKVLRTIELPKFNYDTCKAYWKILTPTSVCYGYTEEGRDLSPGDYGGPLVGNKKLVGIASRGVVQMSPKKPSIYTNVAHPSVHDFITENLYNPHS